MDDEGLKTSQQWPQATGEKVPSGKEDKESASKTDWRAIGLATFIAFLCSVENNIIGMSEWPYMITLDKEATSSFFGLVTSICRVGHALFALIFAAWAHRMRQTKYPLLAGRVLALAGCCLYLLVEFIPSHRRFYMLLCYFLFGTGFSTSPLLRSYIVRMSAHEERASAYALFNFASMISIIIGPMGQLLFTGISYPGYEILPSIRFHIYSAPIWLALITNIVALVVVGVCFKDPPPAPKHRATLYMTGTSNGSSGISPADDVTGTPQRKLQPPKSPIAAAVAHARKYVVAAPFAWSLVFVCLFEKMITMITVSMLHAVAAPMMMTTFGFDGPTTVRASALATGSVGVLSLGLSALFVFGKLANRISTRSLFLFSLTLVTSMYIISFPWGPVAQPMPAFNATTNSGCDPSRYTWCDTAKASSPFVFLPILVMVMGFAFPSGSISLDTIYSKVLGNIDQSVMQGAIIVAEDVILIVGPLYAAAVFTAFGTEPLWMLNGLIAAVGFVLWLAAWRRLKHFGLE